MFSVEQTFSLTDLTVMCRTIRKTAGVSTRLLRGVCWVLFAAGVSSYAGVFLLGAEQNRLLLLILPVPLCALGGALLFEDRITAGIMRRRMGSGVSHSITAFADNGYTVTMDALQTRYRYSSIQKLIETERYFFFLLDGHYAQIFDKSCFYEGEPPLFRRFIEQKTGKAFCWLD